MKAQIRLGGRFPNPDFLILNLKPAAFPRSEAPPR